MNADQVVEEGGRCVRVSSLSPLLSLFASVARCVCRSVRRTVGRLGWARAASAADCCSTRTT